MARKKATLSVVTPLDDEARLMASIASLAKIADLPEEERKATIARLADEFTLEQLLATQAAVIKGTLHLRARAFTLTGYCCFYELMHGFPPPEHVVREVECALAAYAEDKGAEILAFRGGWKTISIPGTLTPWYIGLFPTSSNLWFQANDSSASKLGLYIADTIRYHPAFAKTFPHVVPDFDRSWSAEGYELKQTHTDANLTTPLSYPEWRKLNSARRDPSLLCLGYNSSSAIGRHPTGILGFDDIHDEDNTRSPLELEAVLKKVTDTFLPMMVRDETQPVGKQLQTWPLVVGTPWNEDDTYHYLPQTGEFRLFEFPVMREVSPETKDALHIDHTNPFGEQLQGWFKLSWPERMGLKAILAAFNVSREHGFWRMYMLQLKAKKGEGVRFSLFPHHLIDPTQDSAGGCDYASMLAERLKDPKDRSRFAHIMLVKIPHLNKLVIHDCYAEHVTQLDAERQLKKPQVVYPRWRGTWLEMEHKGEEAYQTFSRNPGLKLVPTSTKGVPKKMRHEMGVIPWLEVGQVMVSDADTPGLNFLRTALAKWPNGNLDVWDALHHALKAFPEVLVLRDTEQEGTAPHPTWHKIKKVNAYSLAFGRIP